MKTRLLQFIDGLRTAGLAISPAESLDAARALGVFGVERLELREALGATIVKDEEDRAIFEREFDRFFAVPSERSGKRRHTRPSGIGERTGINAQMPEAVQSAKPVEPEQFHSPSDQERSAPKQRIATQEQSRQLHTLANLPFERMTPDQITDCDLLLRRLAEQLQGRRRRRLRRAQHGRLDLRRTLRGSVGYGGVPIVPAFRHPRPGKPDLVALCDLSHSVAQASRFLLSLLSSAPALYRRVRLFGYVDVPVEIWLQDGHLVHDEKLDLYARSDFGRVLERFWETQHSLLTRNTLLLILGDARNNRRPPRADLLARMEHAVQRLAWLNPDPRERWDTGDSVVRTYARYCTDLLSAGTPRELYVALKTVVI